MPLGKDEIKKRFKKPLARKEVLVPELDVTNDDGTVEAGKVTIRVWNGVERAEYNRKISGNYKHNIALLVMQMSMCDEDGNLLFTEAEIPEIGAWPGTSIERIGMAALQLNWVDPAKIQEHAKNSDGTDGAAQSSVFLDGSPRVPASS